MSGGYYPKQIYDSLLIQHIFYWYIYQPNFYSGAMKTSSIKYIPNYSFHVHREGEKYHTEWKIREEEDSFTAIYVCVMTVIGL